MMMAYTDTELYRMLCDSSARAALGELYNRYSQRVYAYCCRILGDRETAEDILQESFMQLYRSGMQETNVVNVQSYLFRIARNLCLNHRKKHSNRSVPVEEFRFPVHDRSYENKELSQLIAEALELLPDDYREAFVLREYNCMSYAEIAEMLNISIDTVKVRLFRAKKKMREVLAPYFESLKE